MLTLLILSLIVYCYVYRNELTQINRSSALVAPALVPLIAAGVTSGAQALHARGQRRKAARVKESNYVPPELTMNKDLAQLMAFSREAPGAAKARENVRRAQANTLSAVKRMAGGDTGKIAAVSVASQQAAQDGMDRIDARGQEFAEGAFGRVYGSNLAIAGQRRQNRNEFNQAKISLLRASDQNYMTAFNSLMQGAMASAYLGSGAGGSSGGFGGGARPASTGFGSNTPTDSYGRFFPSNMGYSY